MDTEKENFEGACKQGKILIVDDEKGFLMTTAELLRRKGFACHACESIEDARRVLGNELFDLLISDIRFPEESGMDLAAQIPELNRGIPIIIVTAYPTLETAITAIDNTVLGYQLKPLDLPPFYDLVERGVQHGRFRSVLKGAARRYQGISVELQQLQQHASENLGFDINQGIADHIRLLLQMAATTLVDIHESLELLPVDAATVPVRKLAHNPEVGLLRAAVKETVGVLEQTKKSFKSRELAELRQKLEMLMNLIDAEAKK